MIQLKPFLTDPIIFVTTLMGFFILGIIIFFMIRRDKKTKALLESQAKKRNGRLVSETLSSSGQDLEISFKGNKILVGFDKGDTHHHDPASQKTTMAYNAEPSKKVIDIFHRFLRRNALKGENIQVDIGANDAVFDKEFSISTSDPDFAKLFLIMDVRRKILDLKHKISDIMIIGKGIKINFDQGLPCEEKELDVLIDAGIYFIRHLDKIQDNK